MSISLDEETVGLEALIWNTRIAAMTLTLKLSGRNVACLSYRSKHTHTHTHTHARTHAHTHARVHAHTHTRTHAHTHARVHAHTHTHTRTHAHTHTLMALRPGSERHSPPPPPRPNSPDPHPFMSAWSVFAHPL